MSHPPYLADPASLPSHNAENILQVVIETPRNSRNKYAYKSDRKVLVLRKVLPAGMVFPFDFGFVPSTTAADGDPIDVLVLMEEPAFPGCVLDARILGIIEGEDHLNDGTVRRNDRILAAALASHAYKNIQTIDDLPKQLLDSIQDFFQNYPRLLGEKTYKVLACKGPLVAASLIEQAQKPTADPVLL